MPSVQPPKKTQVLVVGGGPAGSYAAAALARDGFHVVLLEMAKFPRYHIGESLIPSVRHYLRFIDADNLIAQHGFAPKPGSAIKFNQYMREGYTDFIALGAENSSWNVVRAEFDHLLLQHAAAAGAHVFDQTRVTQLRFAHPWPTEEGPEGDDVLRRPVSAKYETVLGGTGEVSFDYLVDASGRAGLMSTKYLKNRKLNQSLKNVAVWGYWRGTGMYGAGTDRQNAPYFEALSDESGWAWFIPLHTGLTSVGVVMDQKELGLRSRASSSASARSASSALRRPTLTTRVSSSLADRYLAFLQLAPGVVGLIGDGELVHVGEDGEGGEEPLTRSASDYSYSADRYAGDGWRVVGDAGAFIDPFFSSGVHLAMTGALAAAASIAASLRGDCTELEAASWHSSRVAVSYTRFLVVVLSAYKQIRAQSSNVLADIHEDNFDKAFAFFRPLIQGGAEMGARLSEDEVQRALDFCVHLFSPTTPAQHDAVRHTLSGLPPSRTRAPSDASSAGEHEREDLCGLLDANAPVVDPAKLERLLRRHVAPRFAAQAQNAGCDEEAEMKMVLDKVNARRVIQAEHGNGLNNLEQEPLDGFVVRLQRGRLGLDRAV